MSDLRPAPPRTEHVEQKLAKFHAEFVDEVRKAIAAHDVVVVGMAQNPHCRRARRVLDEAGVAFHYIEEGSYLGGWQRRLAVKLWAGFPTFPMVFVKGTLIGGADEVTVALKERTLQSQLDGAAT
jgi:monothiol glutaredoxin